MPVKKVCNLIEGTMYVILCDMILFVLYLYSIYYVVLLDQMSSHGSE